MLNMKLPNNEKKKTNSNYLITNNYSVLDIIKFLNKI